jgi:quercetin dioxygenase-like cupin family protein
MATLITKPSVIEAAGNKPKIIQEFIGRVNSKTAALSMARMKSPSGWVEPGQTPEFDEYTLVLRGVLRVTTKSGVTDVTAEQAIIVPKGEWVCSMAHQDRREQSMLRYVCRLSHRKRYIGMKRRFGY